MLLWWALGDRRLTENAKRLLLESGSTRFVSAVSAFEISYKVKIGKLDAAKELVDRFDEVCDRLRLERLDLSVAHALRAGKLEGAHFDPFDRMIAAQAIIEGLPVLTVDRQFKALGAEVVWG